eukprot:5757147-Pleurochrysis_carterae.AAC.2
MRWGGGRGRGEGEREAGTEEGEAQRRRSEGGEGEGEEARQESWTSGGGREIPPRLSLWQMVATQNWAPESTQTTRYIPSSASQKRAILMFVFHPVTTRVSTKTIERCTHRHWQRRRRGWRQLPRRICLLRGCRALTLVRAWYVFTRARASVRYYRPRLVGILVERGRLELAIARWRRQWWLRFLPGQWPRLEGLLRRRRRDRPSLIRILVEGARVELAATNRRWLLQLRRRRRQRPRHVRVARGGGALARVWVWHVGRARRADARRDVVCDVSIPAERRGAEGHHRRVPQPDLHPISARLMRDARLVANVMRRGIGWHIRLRGRWAIACVRRRGRTACRTTARLLCACLLHGQHATRSRLCWRPSTYGLAPLFCKADTHAMLAAELASDVALSCRGCSL